MPAFARHVGASADMEIGTWVPEGASPSATIFIMDTAGKIPVILHSPTFTARSIAADGVVDAGAEVLLQGWRDPVTLSGWDPGLIA